MFVVEFWTTDTFILLNTSLSLQVIGFCSVAAFSENQEGPPHRHLGAQTTPHLGACPACVCSFPRIRLKFPVLKDLTTVLKQVLWLDISTYMFNLKPFSFDSLKSH